MHRSLLQQLAMHHLLAYVAGPYLHCWCCAHVCDVRLQCHCSSGCWCRFSCSAQQRLGSVCHRFCISQLSAMLVQCRVLPTPGHACCCAQPCAWQQCVVGQSSVFGAAACGSASARTLYVVADWTPTGPLAASSSQGRCGAAALWRLRSVLPTTTVVTVA